MEKCEFLDTCPDQGGELKEKYCLNNNLNCARYMVINSLGAENTPADLMASEKEKAYMHIAQNG